MAVVHIKNNELLMMVIQHSITYFGLYVKTVAKIIYS